MAPDPVRWPFDHSIDWFGMTLSICCTILGVHLHKPEWELWKISACTIAGFLALTWLPTGRRLRKPDAQKAKAS